MSEALELPIAGRTLIATGTLEVLFDLEDNHFNFIAGQYMRVTFPHPLHDDGKGNCHEFSIASSPNEKQYVKLACRMSESSFKKNLQESPLGTIVLIEGPFGVFTLPKDQRDTIVCIAGGIGITPFLSMATFAAEEHLPRKVILLYANSSPETAAYRTELLDLEKTNCNFSLIQKIGVLDDAFVLESAKQCFIGSSACAWYIAGPPRMVQSARKTLIRRGIGEEKIRTEEFSNYDI